MTSNCSAYTNPEVASLCKDVNDQVASAQADTNAFFLVWASSLVLFMHAGFAMLSA